MSSIYLSICICLSSSLCLFFLYYIKPLVVSVYLECTSSLAYSVHLLQRVTHLLTTLESAGASINFAASLPLAYVNLGPAPQETPLARTFSDSSAQTLDQVPCELCNGVPRTVLADHTHMPQSSPGRSKGERQFFIYGSTVFASNELQYPAHIGDCRLRLRIQELMGRVDSKMLQHFEKRSHQASWARSMGFPILNDRLQAELLEACFAFDPSLLELYLTSSGLADTNSHSYNL